MAVGPVQGDVLREADEDRALVEDIGSFVDNLEVVLFRVLFFNRRYNKSRIFENYQQPLDRKMRFTTRDPHV